MPEPFASQPASERFEVASRGDLVPGRLWTGAPGPSLRPLVVIVPGLDAGKDASEVERLGRAVAAEGWAAAAIDLPLQGERANAKLSARLARCTDAEPAGGADRVLWEEFLRQTAFDLAATFAALEPRHRIDVERVACVAYAAGAVAAEGWAARDPRVRILLRAEPGAGPEALIEALRREFTAR